jgi:hypothetical protein
MNGEYKMKVIRYNHDLLREIDYPSGFWDSKIGKFILDLLITSFIVGVFYLTMIYVLPFILK